MRRSPGSTPGTVTDGQTVAKEGRASEGASTERLMEGEGGGRRKTTGSANGGAASGTMWDSITSGGETAETAAGRTRLGRSLLSLERRSKSEESLTHIRLDSLSPMEA